MDEDNLLRPEAADDFELPIASYATRSPSQDIDFLSNNNNDFQPQLVEEPLSSSPSFRPSSPPSHLEDEEPEGRMPSTTEYHPFINGGYYITYSLSTY
jgi:hypothetical protein